VRCWRSERTWDTQPGKWQKTWERQLFTPSTYRKTSLWSAIQNKIFPRRTLILLPVELSAGSLTGIPVQAASNNISQIPRAGTFTRQVGRRFFSSMAPTLTNIARMTLKNVLSFVGVEACFSGTIAMRLILEWCASSLSGGAKERTLSGSRALPSHIGKAPEHDPKRLCR
jgi:hypothetical protein